MTRRFRRRVWLWWRTLTGQCVHNSWTLAPPLGGRWWVDLSHAECTDCGAVLHTYQSPTHPAPPR